MDSKVQRDQRTFFELEKAIPQITQKMLGRQLCRLKVDGIIERTSYPQVAPKVEYRLTEWLNHSVRCSTDY